MSNLKTIILAYLIVGREFLESLLSPFFGGGNLIYTLIYFLFGAILIFFGIKAIAKSRVLSPDWLFLDFNFDIFPGKKPY